MPILLILLAATTPSQPDPTVRSRSAYVSTLTTSFHQADKNKDSALDVSELVDAATISLKLTQLSSADQASLRKGVEANLAAMDSNGDGRLSLDEMLRVPLAHFDCLDANHDGLIPQSEAEANIDRCEAAAGVRP